MDTLDISERRNREWERLGRLCERSLGTNLVCHLNELYTRHIDRDIVTHYHSVEHMKAVAIRAMSLYAGGKIEVHSNLPTAVLFIAGSLHDILHSGGQLTDDRNIQIACKEIQKLSSRGIWIKKIMPMILETVEITQYPFVREPSNQIQKCIRDADLMMIDEPDWPVFRRGLEIEMGRTIHPIENLEFLVAQTYYTDYGQYNFLPRMQNRLEELRSLTTTTRTER